MGNDQVKNQALEQPGAKRYVCGLCGTNASTKLYVCGHCKVTRYCSAAHQKKDKKNHVGKVCNDLRKSRKQYRKHKHNKVKNSSTANDDIDPSSADLQLWNKQQQQNHEEQHEDDSNERANVDPPTSRSRQMLSCKWWTNLVWGLFVLGAYNLCCRRCCFRCCRFQSEDRQLRKCNKQTYRWMHRSPKQLCILMFIVLGCLVGKLFGSVILLQQHGKSGRIDGSKKDFRNEKKLFDACTRGHLKTATRLLQINGIDVNRRSKKKHFVGSTPLIAASAMGRLDIVQVLFTKKELQVNKAMFDGGTALWIASQIGHSKVVQALLTRKEIQVNQADDGGNTPLHTACHRGRLKVVQVLLTSKKIQINLASPEGYTPLWIACQNGHLKIVQVLLKKKEIQINQATNRRFTPLYIACQYGHLKVVQVLLRRKEIQINQANINGATPLYIACQHGHLKVVRLLLTKKEIQINEAGNNTTPIHMASYLGHTEIVRLLLQQPNIDIQKKDDWGDTPESSASKKGFTAEIVTLLQQHGNKKNTSHYKCTRQQCYM